MTAPAHPNCRCYLAPFRREWVEAGLIDEEYWRKARAEIDKLVPDQFSGASPFEKANGRPPPKAVWSPGSGWAA